MCTYVGCFSRGNLLLKLLVSKLTILGSLGGLCTVGGEHPAYSIVCLWSRCGEVAEENEIKDSKIAAASGGVQRKSLTRLTALSVDGKVCAKVCS